RDGGKDSGLSRNLHHADLAAVLLPAQYPSGVQRRNVLHGAVHFLHVDLPYRPQLRAGTGFRSWSFRRVGGDDHRLGSARGVLPGKVSARKLAEEDGSGTVRHSKPLGRWENFHKSFTKKEGRQGNTANFAAETCQAPVNLL